MNFSLLICLFCRISKKVNHDSTNKHQNCIILVISTIIQIM